MVLENWRAFVLEPIGPSLTRMHIRSRGAGVPSVTGIAITPVSLLVFEPAHFIMEREMMLGIKQRAEAAVVAAQKDEEAVRESLTLRQ
jgi:hypothetical protein